MSDTPHVLPTNPLSRLAQRMPLTVFLAGTFLWAWALWGYWLPAMPPTGLVITPAFIICAIVGGFAPSLAAIATSWLIGGGQGVRHLFHGLTHWKAPPLHYGLALGIVPGTTILALSLFPALTGAPMRPADPSIMAMAAIWPIVAALGEELGWRGFFFPRLVKHYGLMGAAIIVGLVWGLWHLPADFVGLKGYGGLFWLAFLVNGPFVLTAHALIMAWLWRRTGANLVMMVLYHWSITATAMIAPTAGGQDWTGIGVAAFTATALWIVAILLWVTQARAR